ncbi:MAG: type III pantothenate kinase [Prolixibacteraceae bacterium]|jgi:type III pantothenate kinase|nr:type III pantothenate kinase [Prolixibacteraceae bacterium]MDD4756065.1 type III pantothenate kinase [Prolixibacteraceae bacterium]NLO00955.1 type III pantothenate kinase [Bacteroidales bacterium]
MNLVIDIGNSFSKIAVFNNEELISVSSVSEVSNQNIDGLKQKYTSLNRAIVSSVKNFTSETELYLKQNFDTFLMLDHNTPVPIENCYQTKKTLGNDRLAAVIGAFSLDPDTNKLIIDAGTALTFDFINEKNQYLGGKISPGLEMRFKALHQFTARLPQLGKGKFDKLFGSTTAESILAGVQQGIIYETDKTIDMFKEFYTNLKVFITGGDANFFDKKLKNSFFVNFNLTVLGLNRILEYNGEI